MNRRVWSGGAVLGVTIAALAFAGAARSGGDAAAPVLSPKPRSVVFSGGCFWGVQAVFQHVKGVQVATSGFAGGSAKTASYRLTTTGATGHAESVRVVFDPSVVSFEQLLDVFFTVAHDPTQLNRQGPDVGPQYRSAVWTTSEEQTKVVRDYIAGLERAKKFDRPIVTEVNSLDGFYPAEEYHQDYLIHHPNSAYIRINDLPKLRHLEKAFPKLWRDETAPWRAETAEQASS